VHRAGLGAQARPGVLGEREGAVRDEQGRRWAGRHLHTTGVVAQGQDRGVGTGVRRERGG
jgi:hypothetical protein